MLRAFKDLECIEAQVYQNDEIILRVFEENEGEFRDSMVNLMSSMTSKEPLMLVEFPSHKKLGVVWRRTNERKT